MISPADILNALGKLDISSDTVLLNVVCGAQVINDQEYEAFLYGLLNVVKHNKRLEGMAVLVTTEPIGDLVTPMGEKHLNNLGWYKKEPEESGPLRADN